MSHADFIDGGMELVQNNGRFMTEIYWQIQIHFSPSDSKYCMMSEISFYELPRFLSINRIQRISIDCWMLAGHCCSADH